MPYKNIISVAAAASLAGAVLSLDRTAAFQVMVSRPIVAAPIIGYLLGGPEAGLLAGITLELLFIGDPPVGAHVPVHETGLSVLVTVLTIAFLEVSGTGGNDAARRGVVTAMPALTVALMIGIPVSLLYQKADTLARRVNIRFYRRASAALESGRPVCLMRENLKGLLSFFAASAISLFITVLPLTYAVRIVFSGVTLHIGHLYPAFAGCLILGAASAYNAASAGRGAIIFTASGIAVTAIEVIAG
ncbi:MAG: PTS sugar transporter subunit IIC [Deltaproteobacteria bacterium]|nr:PTS sugar transporter subunit IIC [Deltaproteobacteria bacterium]MBI5810798.1 PTS sugar transporter subunit IIC [Deltaproteobacteria bacterium]